MNTERNRTKKKSRRTVLILIFAVIIVIAVCAAVWLSTVNRALDPGSEDTILVDIRSGSTTSQIAETLEEKGVISSASKFVLKSRMDGNDGKYIAGVYELSPSMTPEAIMAKIISGEQEQTRLTIPEGYTLTQVADAAEKAGVCTAEEFLNETQNGEFNYRFMEYAGSGEKRLEGFLYPETYFIPDGMSAHDIVDLMLEQFDSVFTDEYYERALRAGTDTEGNCDYRFHDSAGDDGRGRRCQGGQCHLQPAGPGNEAADRCDGSVCPG